MITDIFVSPLFWAVWFMLTIYVEYKFIADKKWMAGNRQHIKRIIEGVSAFASGYVFHASLLMWLVQYHNDLISYGWIIFLGLATVLLLDVLRGTKHIKTWGFIMILFVFGMLISALVGVFI